MTRNRSAAGFAVVACCLLVSGGATAAEEVAGADKASGCHASVSELRGKLSAGGAEDGGDHKLLGGLSAETAGLPRENWFGSPPEKQTMLDKLQEADQLAAAGDAEGCRQLADEVTEAMGTTSTGGGRD